MQLAEDPVKNTTGRPGEGFAVNILNRYRQRKDGHK